MMTRAIKRSFSKSIPTRRRAPMTCLFHFIILTIIFLLPPGRSHGQQVDNQESYGKLGFGLGLHTAGYFQGYSFAGKKRPGLTYSLSGDIKLGRVVSLGMLIAYSHASLYVDDATRVGYPGNLTENLVIKGRRYFISQRILFYYFDRPDLALYSGLGIGYAKILRSTDTGWYKYTVPDSDPFGVIQKLDINRNVGRMNFQLVLLGVNLELSKITGLNFELGIGPPYYFNLNFYLKII